MPRRVPCLMFLTILNAGIWLFHCHVNDHIDAGMLERYQVLP
jgi:FtsP/CotA-like multicopper oxidase with cupredoxin domain